MRWRERLNASSLNKGQADSLVACRVSRICGLTQLTFSFFSPWPRLWCLLVEKEREHRKKR